MAIIEITNLNKFYGSKQVLNDINLSVEKGGIIGYIGPNGAGKSTTLKIIAGIIPEFDGYINVLGMDIRESPLSIKKRIGYIPELAAMYDTLTANEYLDFVGKLYDMSLGEIRNKTSELLRLFNLDANADDRINSFSKGMRQKLLLISGLIHNPEIIFLDEPLSGLDANAVILVKEILMQLKLSGKTIFYSSHIMDVVEKISDRIIIIDNGQIIADGTFESLKASAHQGSLENIFTSLTGGDTHTQSTAKDFIEIMKS